MVFSLSNQNLREAEEIYDRILYNTVSGELMLVALQDAVVVGVVLTESYIVILIPPCC